MLFNNNYVLSEADITERLKALNPKFRWIGWENLSFTEMIETNVIIKSGESYKLLS